MEKDEFTTFVQNVIKKAHQSSSDVLLEMLSGNWRASITASMFCAILKKTEYTEIIGEILLRGEKKDANAGYYFAMIAFNTEKSNDYLLKYILKSFALEGLTSWNIAFYQIMKETHRIQTSEQVSIDKKWFSNSYKRKMNELDPEKLKTIILFVFDALNISL